MKDLEVCDKDWEIQELQTSMKDLESQYKSVVLSNEQNSNEVKKLSETVETLRLQNAKYQEEISNLLNQVSENKSQKILAEQQSQQKQKEIEQLKKDTANMRINYESQISNLQGKLKELGNEDPMRSMDQKNEDQKQISLLKKQVTKLQHEEANLQYKISQLTIQNKEQHLNRDQYNQELQNSGFIRQNIEQRCQLLQDQVTQLQLQSQSAEKNLNQAKEEIKIMAQDSRNKNDDLRNITKESKKYKRMYIGFVEKVIKQLSEKSTMVYSDLVEEFKAWLDFHVEKQNMQEANAQIQKMQQNQQNQQNPNRPSTGLDQSQNAQYQEQVIFSLQEEVKRLTQEKQVLELYKRDYETVQQQNNASYRNYHKLNDRFVAAEQSLAKKKMKIKNLQDQMNQMMLQYQNSLQFSQLQRADTSMLMKTCKMQGCRESDQNKLIHLNCGHVICKNHILIHTLNQSLGLIFAIQGDSWQTIRCPICDSTFKPTDVINDVIEPRELQAYQIIKYYREQYVIKKIDKCSSCGAQKYEFFKRGCNCVGSICIECSIQSAERIHFNNVSCLKCNHRMNNKQAQLLYFLSWVKNCIDRQIDPLPQSVLNIHLLSLLEQEFQQQMQPPNRNFVNTNQPPIPSVVPGGPSVSVPTQQQPQQQVLTSCVKCKNQKVELINKQELLLCSLCRRNYCVKCCYPLHPGQQCLQSALNAAKPYWVQ